MELKALVPLAHVRNVKRSIAFYERFGFVVGNSHAPEGGVEPIWAWLVSGGAQLMLAEAGQPIDPDKQAVLFYAYCPDVAGLQTTLLESGLDPSPIQHPFWAPRGEFRVTDPDGYVVMVTHT